jgi:hypothetical protein
MAGRLIKRMLKTLVILLAIEVITERTKATRRLLVALLTY